MSNVFIDEWRRVEDEKPPHDVRVLVWANVLVTIAYYDSENDCWWRGESHRRNNPWWYPSGIYGYGARAARFIGEPNATVTFVGTGTTTTTAATWEGPDIVFRENEPAQPARQTGDIRPTHWMPLPPEPEDPL